MTKSQELEIKLCFSNGECFFEKDYGNLFEYDVLKLFLLYYKDFTIDFSNNGWMDINVVPKVVTEHIDIKFNINEKIN